MSDPAHPSRARLGLWLYATGLALFTACFGAGLGYWASDQGVRWIPDMLAILSGLGAFALVLGVWGRWLWGRAVEVTAEGWRVSRRVLGAVGLVVVAVGLRLAVYAAEQPSPLTELSREEFEDAFAADSRAYRELDAAMERLLSQLEAEPALAVGSTAVLDPEAEERLRERWAQLYELSWAMDRVRLFWEDWWRFDPSRAERPWHLRSFLLTFAAELALYEHSARFTELAERNPNVGRFLNAPHLERGLPENTLSFFQQDLLGSRDQARVSAGRRYLELATAAHARTEARALGVGWLWDSAEQHLRSIRIDTSTLERSARSALSDTQVLRRSVRRVWFPAQKGVAEWFGDTRVRRIGHYLITAEQALDADTRLEPGDVLLSRKNWYLSNVGLPGFWPHAILYLGTPAKLTAWFDTPEVRAWAQAEAGAEAGAAVGLPELLARRHPRAWQAYTAQDHGLEMRVFEAISEGVVFNSLEHAAGDYLAALRPQQDRVAAAQAILAAFAWFERPYDFDFDFATDHALVCTELVWRAWRPGELKAGWEVPLLTVAGRRTLPAQELVRATVEGAEPRPLRFVLFLEGREKAGAAVWADEARFAATLTRPKWDVLQE